MEDSRKIISLLQDIKNELQYLSTSIPDLSNIEDLLAEILIELRP